jgi:predicted transcriptional regulator
MIDTVTDETERNAIVTPPSGTMKLSINVSHEIGNRLRRLAFDRRVSESSIVEVALAALYADRDDADLAQVLREGGASLRRKRVAA